MRFRTWGVSGWNVTNLWILFGLFFSLVRRLCDKPV